MITANYINEGATLIITADGQRHGIPVTDDSQVFCEALFREVNSANAMVDFFAWIVANCKIIHWPGGGHYPIEHAPAANKYGIPHLKAAMNKEGIYAGPLTEPASPAHDDEGQIPHKWNDDGERCVMCGAKDWMSGGCIGSSPLIQPETQSGAQS
jgi:hypothetical protein